jgi:outer membrane protein TolC
MAVPHSAVGQQSAQSALSLPDAVNIALGKNPQRKAAAAEVALAGNQVRYARTGYLPQIGFLEGVSRGNDPVYAFGTRLRQQRFTSADFALNALNTPTPVSDYSTRFTGNWELFHSFQTVFATDQAREMHQAATQALGRADQQIIFGVVASYYGIALAQHKLETAQKALDTANAMLQLSQRLVGAGMAVSSDVMAAQAYEAARQQDVIQSQADLSIARTELETAMGQELSPDVVLTSTTSEAKFAPMSLDDADKQALTQRPDWKQLLAQVQATKNGVRVARSDFGPQLGVFGTWGLDSPHFTGGGGNNWVAGAEIHIDLFNAGKITGLDTAKIQATRMEAAKQSLQDQIRLQVRQAYYQHIAAEQMMQTAHSALAETEEDLRITRNRYDAGLATITDVLRAQDANRMGQMRYWQAVNSNAVSEAALELATGTLSPQSVVVTQ